MKCNSCSEVIPSKFAHSIKTNVCPFCGGEIMSAVLQKILTNLQTIMKKAEDFLPEVEEWLSSNYSLRKVGAKSVQSGDLDDDNCDDATMKKQIAAEKAALEFQKRSGVKTPTMKDMLAKIQMGGGAADPGEFIGEDSEYADMESVKPNNSPLTQKDIIQMAAALDQGQDILNSGGNDRDDDDALKNYYEMEKLKKLQRPSPNGAGKFSRGE